MQEAGSFRALRPKHRCVASVEKECQPSNECQCQSKPLVLSCCNQIHESGAWWLEKQRGYNRDRDRCNRECEWKKGKKTKESVKGASDAD